MKSKIYLILAALLVTTGIYAQAPQKMSYKAVIRDNSNASNHYTSRDEN